MDLGELCSRILGVIRTFFSLIIACLMAVLTVLYVIGAGLTIAQSGSFAKSGFAHFLAIIFAILTAICYLVLHFVPRKAYRLLYALTFLFLITMLLVAHSLGLSAPVVTDCNSLNLIPYNEFMNMSSLHDLGNIVRVRDAEGREVIIGKLGEHVEQCVPNSLLFATSFLNLILYIVGLFDVQAVLLARVKSKTYGERFVEMGISG